jgi:formylglycine-generating enzyme required for sulfatase activity
LITIYFTSRSVVISTYKKSEKYFKVTLSVQMLIVVALIIIAYIDRARNVGDRIAEDLLIIGGLFFTIAILSYALAWICAVVRIKSPALLSSVRKRKSAPGNVGKQKTLEIIGMSIAGLLMGFGFWWFYVYTEGTPETQTSNQPADKTVTYSIGMEFVLIPAGSFMMGSADDAQGADENEKPAHRVTISKPFYLGKYEVTQAQWEAVMGNNPSNFKGQNNPVELVSWNDVQTFIERLNQKEGTKKYRLPTEAEWEYAARAGTTTAYSFGDDKGSLGQYAWYKDNSGWGTHPVGQKKPNPWGLYDMYGNVEEWVQDTWGSNYYAESPASDPRGPSFRMPYSMIRGGSWFDYARELRSANRDSQSQDLRFDENGFRLAFSPDSP